MTALVLSPHFDDAVLSCGNWLERHPGTIVATVCSGAPGPDIPADPGWDALAHFSTGDEAAEARRAEDLAALGVLGAHQTALGFLDGSFYKSEVGRPHERPGAGHSFEDALALTVGELVDELRPDACLVPLGLLHPDHIATHRAALRSLKARPKTPVIFYLDLPYGIASEQAAQDRIDGLAASGIGLSPLPDAGSPPAAAKLRAADCYRSQLPLLEDSFGDSLWASFDPGAERLFKIQR
jgi:LmbE family N-acetylglucosaminyl deacetylase